MMCNGLTYVAVFDIPGLDVCRGKAFSLSNFLAVGGDLTTRKCGACACGYFEVVDKTLFEVVKIRLQRRLGECLGGG